MPKRCRDNSYTDAIDLKRIRPSGGDDRLSSLSDELLLHILSFLPRSSLITCQRVSRRFYNLGGDSELWKRQYYARWVWPRARRLVKARRATLPLSKAEYSPVVSTWLDHSHLASEGEVTSWKRQYRLRHNWSQGICRLTEVELSQTSQPRTLVELCAGLIFTADIICGLRAWIAKDPKSCVASIALTDLPVKPTGNRRVAPTALTATRSQSRKTAEIGVGFQDGRVNMYELDLGTPQLALRFAHGGSIDGAVTAMASSPPYLLTLTQQRVVSLYELPGSSQAREEPKDLRLLASLRADSMVAPISLSLRSTASEIVASIVYSFFHLSCGWSVGIQELRLNKNGQQISSQLATTVDSQHGTVFSARSLQNPHSTTYDGGLRSSRPRVISTGAPIVHQEPPTSVSYSHPYLLTSHSDNTMTLYLVVSTTENLLIRSGQRLWGHTSSVCTVHVSDRGKAVSVTARGDEMRIWELEPSVSLTGAPKELKEGNSIPIVPENIAGGKRAMRGTADWKSETGRPSLGEGERVEFNEELVVVVRQGKVGRRLLGCYDFT